MYGVRWLAEDRQFPGEEDIIIENAVVNNDGEIDIFDCLLIAEYIVGAVEEL